jgi:hypothetical protein
VVENHEGGTGPILWQGRAEAKTSKVKTEEFNAGVDDESPVRWRGSLETPREAPGEDQAKTTGMRLERKILERGCRCSCSPSGQRSSLPSILKELGSTMDKPILHTP